jgi:hypothetical protein
MRGAVGFEVAATLRSLDGRASSIVAQRIPSTATGH